MVLEALVRRLLGALAGVEQRADDRPGVFVDQGVVAGDDVAQFGLVTGVDGALPGEAQGDLAVAGALGAPVDGDVLQPVSRRIHQQLEIAQILVGEGEQLLGQPRLAAEAGEPGVERVHGVAAKGENLLGPELDRVPERRLVGPGQRRGERDQRGGEQQNAGPAAAGEAGSGHDRFQLHLEERRSWAAASRPPVDRNRAGRRVVRGAGPIAVHPSPRLGRRRDRFCIEREVIETVLSSRGPVSTGAVPDSATLYIMRSRVL